MFSRCVPISAVVAALALAAAACSSPAGPTQEELRNQVALELPAYWRISEFTLSAGRKTSWKTFQGRYQGQAELTVPIYIEDRRVEDTLFVRQSGAPGDRRPLYGSVRSRRRFANWRSRVESANDPIADAGIPLESFMAVRVIVVGSDEERRFLEAQAQAGAEGAAEASQDEKAAGGAEAARLAELLIGEWRGSLFNETDSRLEVRLGAAGPEAWLTHTGYREALSVEFFAGGRVRLTGTSVERIGGGEVNYHLDTFDLRFAGDGDVLEGRVRDAGGSTSEVHLRKAAG